MTFNSWRMISPAQASAPGSGFLLRGSQSSRANSLAHAELSAIDVLPVSAIGLGMVAAANLVEVAALVGDTARATMLNALMGGQSLTATELAFCIVYWSSDGSNVCRTAVHSD